MSKYEFEQELDNLLGHLVKFGVNRAYPIDAIPQEVYGHDLRQNLDILVSHGLIKYFEADFGDTKQKFHQLILLTPVGIEFHRYQGFVSNAKRMRKENRRWNLEYWKLGYDSLIAILALILSIIALIFSLEK